MAEAVGEKSVMDAASYDNNPDIEEAWANRAVDHMEVHFNLITAVDPQTLKLTPYDEEIYNAFKEAFPEFRLDVLEEDSLKSKENKQKWNSFCRRFSKIDDGTFGTLVRIRSTDAYTDQNTIFVVRIQFLAVEIARNREGLNNFVYQNHKKEK